MNRKHVGFFFALVALLLTVAAGTAATQEETFRPEPRHEASAQVIGELLSRYHFRQRELDAQLSAAAFDEYLSSLDSQRYFFLAEDIERFAVERDQLGEQLGAGQLDIAWDIFETYRERVNERSEYAREVLAGDLDFSDDERFDLERADADWPADRAELNEIWRKRVENDVLSLRLADTDEAEIQESLDDRYRQLARNLEQYTADDIFEIYMNSWAELFDPHTSYLSPRTRENFDINMSLSLQGIGALLRSDGNFTEIVELIQGGPAAKSEELDVGDRIVGVGQEGDPYVSVVGWRLPAVVELIRGPKGSVVRLQVQPASASESGRRNIELTRNEIVLEDRAARSSVETPDEGGGRVGVIELGSFYHDFESDRAGDAEPRSTTRDVRDLLHELTREEDIDGLIIDLRGNSGGSLLEATRLTGLFVDAGPIVQVRYSDGEQSVLGDEGNGSVVYDGPLTVLVDGYSASASEIFAAAIQDYGRGVIAGGQTFGKGTVQDLVDLDRYRVAEDGDAGSLKFTRAKYYRITGGSTQMRGVEPDVSLEGLLNGSRSATERAEPNALAWDEIESLSFERARDLEPVIPELLRRHEQRLESSRALDALREGIALREEERERTAVSLNETVRRGSERQFEEKRLTIVNRRLQALDMEPLERLEDLDEGEIPDLVLRETARITLDLGELLAKREENGRMSVSADS